MALGAITIVDKTVFGDKRVTFGSGVLSTGANYPSDGEPITAADFGLNTLLHLQVETAGSLSIGVALRWDKATSVLVAYECGADGDPLDEAPNASDFSTYTFTWMAWGN
jgi:hypothetical protein